MDILYHGERLPHTPPIVTRSCGGVASILNPRWDLWNHSPDGFEWGYLGSGPAQLAIALLADALGVDEAAQDEHQHFKRSVISQLKGGSWSMTASSIREWYAANCTVTIYRDEQGSLQMEDF